jgi:hypothetical protein
MVLRISGLKRDGGTRGCRKLHNGQLHNWIDIWKDQVKEDEMGRECRRNGDDNYTYDIGGKARRK